MKFRHILGLLAFVQLISGVWVSNVMACTIQWQPMTQEMAKEYINRAHFIGVVKVMNVEIQEAEIKNPPTRREGVLDVIEVAPEDGHKLAPRTYAGLLPLQVYKQSGSFKKGVLMKVEGDGDLLSPCNPTVKPRHKDQILEVILTSGALHTAHPESPLNPQPDFGEVYHLETWILGEALKELRKNTPHSENLEKIKNDCIAQNGIWMGDRDSPHTINFWCDIPAGDEWKICKNDDECEGFCTVDQSAAEEEKYKRKSLIEKIGSLFYAKTGRCSHLKNRACGYFLNNGDVTGQTCRNKIWDQ